MRVDVTQAYIDAGLPHQCTRCPVALAIQRVMPPGSEVDVAGPRIYWTSGDDGDVIDSPEEVGEFVFNFDRGLPVAPFSFHLPVSVAP